MIPVPLLRLALRCGGGAAIDPNLSLSFCCAERVEGISYRYVLGAESLQGDSEFKKTPDASDTESLQGDSAPKQGISAPPTPDASDTDSLRGDSGPKNKKRKAVNKEEKKLNKTVAWINSNAPPARDSQRSASISNAPPAARVTKLKIRIGKHIQAAEAALQATTPQPDDASHAVLMGISHSDLLPKPMQDALFHVTGAAAAISADKSYLEDLQKKADGLNTDSPNVHKEIEHLHRQAEETALHCLGGGAAGISTPLPPDRAETSNAADMDAILKAFFEQAHTLGPDAPTFDEEELASVQGALQNLDEVIQEMARPTTTLDGDANFDAYLDSLMTETLGSSFMTRLKPYQKDGIKVLMRVAHDTNFRGIWLADGPGLGKSVQALGFAMLLIAVNKQLRLQAGGRPQQKKGGVLIVVPPSLLSNWEDEAQRWKNELVYGRRPEPRILTIPDMQTAKTTTQIHPDSIVIMVNSVFTHVGGRDKKAKRGRDNQAVPPPPHLAQLPPKVQQNLMHAAFLAEQEWLAVITDEAHTCKTPKSIKHLVLMYVMSLASKNVLMSGTPMVNCERDMLGLSSALVSNAPFTSAKDVHSRYMLRRVRERSGTTVETSIVRLQLNDDEDKVYKAIEDLARKDIQALGNVASAGIHKMNIILKLRMFVSDPGLFYKSLQRERQKKSSSRLPATREEQLQWLRDNTADEVDCELLEEHLDDEADRLVDRTFWAKFAEQQRFHMDELERCGLGLGALDGTGTKTLYAVQLIDKMVKEDPASPILVFTQFVDQQELLKDMLKNLGHSCAVMRGNMQPASRKTAIKACTQGQVNVFLIMLQCGNCGLNLQVAYRIIFMEPSWVPSMEEQAICRANRLGQLKDTIKVYRLVVVNTVEERAMEIQNDKLDLLQTIFEEKSLQRLLGITAA